ncbi:MAG TPA: Maf family protein [Planctomicrobium sp.]|nr:Maf family protein [Planctomicrobium sp.]
MPVTDSMISDFTVVDPIILGSNSPRRRELLSLIVPSERIIVRPPADSNEAGFEGLHDIDSIRERVCSIAAGKMEQLLSVCGNLNWQFLITADTIVVATDSDGTPVVIGKPDGTDWKQTVRHWFRNYYSNQSHEVMTAVCLRKPDGSVCQLVERTTLHFRDVTDGMLEWYIQTEEPLGKAGGYGLQGAGSLFVKSVEGSLSNVIGLPLEAVREILREWNLLAIPSTS